jgi:hypothetical protein
MPPQLQKVKDTPNEILYRKVGNEFRPAYEEYNDLKPVKMDDFFVTEGVWLVQKHASSRSYRRLLLDDFSELFPFARMLYFEDDLSNFIVEEEKSWQQNSKTINGQKMYTVPPPAERARNILKFLADKSKEK